MNWQTVRRHNAKASLRKAKRESREAERKRRTEAAGGPIKVEEIRTATYRTERPAPGHIHDRHVWTFRGKDWVLGYSDGDRWQAMAPFRLWSQDADTREFVQLTPAAGKWLGAELDRIFPAA